MLLSLLMCDLRDNISIKLAEELHTESLLAGCLVVISAVIVSGGCNHTVVIQLTEIFTIGPPARSLSLSLLRS